MLCMLFLARVPNVTNGQTDKRTWGKNGDERTDKRTGGKNGDERTDECTVKMGMDARMDARTNGMLFSKVG